MLPRPCRVRLIVCKAINMADQDPRSAAGAQPHVGFVQDPRRGTGGENGQQALPQAREVHVVGQAALGAICLRSGESPVDAEGSRDAVFCAFGIRAFRPNTMGFRLTRLFDLGALGFVGALLEFLFRLAEIGKAGGRVVVGMWRGSSTQDPMSYSDHAQNQQPANIEWHEANPA